MKKRPFLAAAAALAGALLLAAGPASSAEVKADAAAGGHKVAMCIGCHGIAGYKASFPEVYQVPKIAGQNAKYLAAALVEYKKGERRHPSMRAIATTLSEQDIADITAYYEQLGKANDGAPPPAEPAAPSPEVAKALTGQTCTSCHGANFSTPIDPAYPKLAGQHADYLYAALTAYQTRHNNYFGRDNAIMMGMAASLTHAQIKEIAGYIASLPGDLKTVPQSRFR